MVSINKRPQYHPKTIGHCFFPREGLVVEHRGLRVSTFSCKIGRLQGSMTTWSFNLLRYSTSERAGISISHHLQSTLDQIRISNPLRILMQGARVDETSNFSSYQSPRRHHDLVAVLCSIIDGLFSDP